MEIRELKSERTSKKAPGEQRSTPVLHAWPDRLQVPLQAAAEKNRPRLVGISVRNVQPRGHFDGSVFFARVEFRLADKNDDFSCVVARPPQKIILMAADSFRQAIPRPEKIDGASLAVVVAENGGLRLLLRRQRVI